MEPSSFSHMEPVSPAISDRVVCSSPPTTYESSTETVESVHYANREAAGSFGYKEYEGTRFVPYPRERPERPGETQSEYSEGESRVGADTLIDEEEPVEVDDRKTDRFGFYTDGTPRAVSRPLSLDRLRKREQKWLLMFENWKYYMDTRFDKVKSRCRKGIPPSLRAKAWKFLSGASYQMEVSANNKHIFEYCVRQPGDPRVIDEIERDLDRQFPSHEMFAISGKYASGGKEDLLYLLKAWTILHPEEGYCQGQAPVASVLLMHMPVKDAFYVFVQICHKYLPGYFSPGLEAVQLDGDILMQVLKEKAKTSYKHLKRHAVESPLFMIEWFMCVYCRTLPWPSVLRVWDMFLCEGVKVMFKVAVVMVKGAVGTSSQCKQYNDMHSILVRLRNLPSEVTDEDLLVKKVLSLDLDDTEMERLHYRAVKIKQTRKLKAVF